MDLLRECGVFFTFAIFYRNLLLESLYESWVLRQFSGDAKFCAIFYGINILLASQISWRHIYWLIYPVVGPGSSLVGLLRHKIFSIYAITSSYSSIHVGVQKYKRPVWKVCMIRRRSPAGRRSKYPYATGINISFSPSGRVSQEKSIEKIAGAS